MSTWQFLWWAVCYMYRLVSLFSWFIRELVAYYLVFMCKCFSLPSTCQFNNWQVDIIFWSIEIIFWQVDVFFDMSTYLRWSCLFTRLYQRVREWCGLVWSLFWLVRYYVDLSINNIVICIALPKQKKTYLKFIF